MPKFSTQSLKHLATLHPDLQKLLKKAINKVDFKIDCGFRGEAEQNDCFARGASTKKWPESKHNKVPSEAADVILYYPKSPHIRWNEKENQYLFMGFLIGLAYEMGLDVRIGADWNGNFDIRDQNFNDLPHLEIILKTGG